MPRLLPSSLTGRLVAFDPARAAWQHQLAFTRLRLAHLALQLGSVSDAAMHWDEAQMLLARMQTSGVRLEAYEQQALAWLGDRLGPPPEVPLASPEG